jgi:hypothetical protein
MLFQAITGAPLSNPWFPNGQHATSKCPLLHWKPLKENQNNGFVDKLLCI